MAEGEQGRSGSQHVLCGCSSDGCFLERCDERGSSSLGLVCRPCLFPALLLLQPLCSSADAPLSDRILPEQQTASPGLFHPLQSERTWGGTGFFTCSRPHRPSSSTSMWLNDGYLLLLTSLQSPKTSEAICVCVCVGSPDERVYF